MTIRQAHIYACFRKAILPVDIVSKGFTFVFKRRNSFPKSLAVNYVSEVDNICR